ncbi:RNA polymeras-like protein II mediator complex component Srb8 [Calycina marina]|uniref:Mediator of RNA polymerase II transcription subunit 12 n=1 Tax=Calycina marina TaxID=1763456 RepID=A0A9P7Z8J2_9HELO|nr:RNA polymeras-like protein II mediator complex component Srb8 [Calycina marina]
MTGRPSLGGTQRQPQKSVSVANIIQWPPPSRTLSQLLPPPSPSRRSNDGLGDMSFEGSDVASNHHGPAITREGSRLKLEMGKSRRPSSVDSPKADPIPTWRPLQQPREKPQMLFNMPSTSCMSSRFAQDGANIETNIKPMPMPKRPKLHATSTNEKPRPVPVVKKDTRPKPFTLETPAAAPHYPPNGRADFFPWTGNHPEDHYNETAIRHGYFDKSNMLQNETGSGRVAVHAKLKDRGGLQMLSSLFTTVLVQRRNHGQITSASTFKPPPRVTVTDTKRETWLKDLANSTIPLRRLSRSIPHGIRGKALLDQSLGKNIPIERAVWLAKCVGANDLRSSRRKGANGTFTMGSETKWIRDFTVCVEQFVESIVGICGEKDFKSRINYAVRLATYFHAEHLLEREHYMDWLVSSLEKAPQEKLPIWLLITQVYWKDLLSFRKFGPRLATALLSHMSETISHPDADILAPLSDRLKTLVKAMLVSNPEDFIAPTSWFKYRLSLESIVEGDQRFKAVFFAIDRRNSQLTPRRMGSAASPRRHLIERLDTTLFKPLLPGFARLCWEIDSDKDLLIQALLEWATSAHRPGRGKVFVAVRVLRQWSRLGAPVTHAILVFLDSRNCENGRDRCALYHLVSELARSGHFSTPIYLQWLIARGGLYSIDDVAEGGPCATRLLAELPTHNFTDSMDAVRVSLLHRVGFPVENEHLDIDKHEGFLNKSLLRMQSVKDIDVDIYDNFRENHKSLSYNVSRTVKSEMGLWLRQKVLDQFQQSTISESSDQWGVTSKGERPLPITAAEFNTIRDYLGATEDYAMLADIVKAVTNSNEPEVLASCADTLNLNFDTFSAIGALSDLFEVLIRRMRAIVGDGSFPRVLLVALSDLATRVPEQEVVAQQLSQELIRSDRKTAADACSPVSDQMFGAMETTELDFTDEMEKILASGNSMDQPTLERLFQWICNRLEESWEKSPDPHRRCGLLLTRLRTFDTQQFDVLMAAWVKYFLNLGCRPSMSQVFGPLISFGSLALKDVAAICASDFAESGSGNSRVSSEMLALLIAPANLPEATTVEEMYHLRIKQRQMQIDQPLESLLIIRRAFENYNFRADSKVDPLQSSHLYEVLQRFIVTHIDLTTKTLTTPALEGDASITSFVVLVDRLLTADVAVKTPLRIPVEKVLGLADDFNLPFCQLKLASMFSTPAVDDAVPEESVTDRLKAFDTAIEAAVAAENTTWTCIVPLLDISIAQHIRTRAESNFLRLFPSVKTIAEDTTNLETNIKQATNFLYIVSSTAYSIIKPSPLSTLATEVVTTFNNTWQVISSSNKTANAGFKNTVITRWLPLLLNFATIHATTVFEHTKPGNEARARTLLALAAILLELLTLSPPPPTLTTQTFDLGLLLVDALPDDMRAQCIKGLRDTTSNEQIRYMFSVAPNPESWLTLVGKGDAGGRDFPLRRWEMLGESTPNVGENDTSLSLTLFGARRG